MLSHQQTCIVNHEWRDTAWHVRYLSTKDTHKQLAQTSLIALHYIIQALQTKLKSILSVYSKWYLQQKFSFKNFLALFSNILLFKRIWVVDTGLPSLSIIW